MTSSSPGAIPSRQSRLPVLLFVFVALVGTHVGTVWQEMSTSRALAKAEGVVVYAQTTSLGFGLGVTVTTEDYDSLPTVLRACVDAHERQHLWDGTWKLPWVPARAEAARRAREAQEIEARRQARLCAARGDIVGIVTLARTRSMSCDP